MYITLSGAYSITYINMRQYKVLVLALYSMFISSVIKMIYGKSDETVIFIESYTQNKDKIDF